ncbi:Trp biosynthesis-associated membrane protein [Actinoplanes awajinensis]|uniref:Trp biosynthesis protein n=1 Tax=Actinoplanes awajinensis subsp. mycoplanecinus TaxID=135947 RepID=A0A124G853_9ACTN|nr:Trp biosynthesis-associated membrane protein [Actinoplanes awajinensis]KUL24867.1 Trp biosynthesis protein [Actinoplanes awajinensis subsp. mycoplanecinus]
MNRRSHLAAIAACLAGAGLTLYAVTRTWSLTVEHRAGLTDLSSARTGADAQPWLIGLAVVALAGAGALLATRGLARRVLGGLLTLAGIGVMAGAILARTGTDAGEAGAGAVFWLVAAVLGGAAITLGGVLAARHGHRWAAMSARYDRPAAPAPVTTRPESAELAPADNRAAWDALDRGDDPTA